MESPAISPAPPGRRCRNCVQSAGLSALNPARSPPWLPAGEFSKRKRVYDAWEEPGEGPASRGGHEKVPRADGFREAPLGSSHHTPPGHRFTAWLFSKTVFCYRCTGCPPWKQPALAEMASLAFQSVHGHVPLRQGESQGRTKGSFSLFMAQPEGGSSHRKPPPPPALAAQAP